MSTSKLSICMLLPDPYDPGMPARPAVMEIYGECFPLMGHRVVWIMPAKETLKEVERNHFKDVPIYVVPQYVGPSLFIRVLAKPLFLFREARLASRIMREEKCNIVQARNSIVLALLGIYLKTKYKAPLVFQFSFPGGDLARYDLRGNKLTYLMGKLQRFLTPHIMRGVDLILPISELMADQLADDGIPREKMIPLPLGANAESFSPTINGRETRREHNLGSSAVVIYLGILDRLRQLEILIRAIAYVKQQEHEVKLLMVGEGDDRANLERLARTLGVDGDVVFTGQVPYHEVPRVISAADVAVSPVPPLDIYKTSSPCKLFEYMGAAKPVVANEEIAEHKEVLEESGGGILVPFTPEGFASAIIELLDDPEKASNMGRRGRKWVVENRTYSKLAKDVESGYYTLLEIR